MTAQKDTGEAVNIRIPQKIWLLMLVALLGGSTLGSGWMSRVIGSDGVSKSEYSQDRQTDSLKRYFWQRDIQEDVDTLKNVTKRIEQLLNKLNKK